MAHDIATGPMSRETECGYRRIGKMVTSFEFHANTLHPYFRSTHISSGGYNTSEVWQTV